MFRTNEIINKLRYGQVQIAVYDRRGFPDCVNFLHAHDSWEVNVFFPAEGKTVEISLVPPLVLHHVNNAPGCLESYCFEYVNGEKKFFVSSSNQMKIRNFNAAQIEQLCLNDAEALFTTVAANGADYNYVCSWLLVFFSAAELLLKRREVEIHLPENPLARQLAAIIVAAYFEPSLTVAKIAAQANVSLNYASKIFHQATGQTITGFLQSFRLEKALILLKSGRYSVKEVSLMTGWNSQLYFSTRFKRYFKITPSEAKRLPLDRYPAAERLRR